MDATYHLSNQKKIVKIFFFNIYDFDNFKLKKIKNLKKKTKQIYHKLVQP